MITTKMPTMPLNIPLWCTITKIKLLYYTHTHTYTHTTITKQLVLSDCKMQKLQYYYLFLLALVLSMLLCSCCWWLYTYVQTHLRLVLMLRIYRITNNKQLQKQGKINKSHLLFFLTGGVGLQAVPPNPDNSWLPEKAWTQIFRASDLEG